MANIDDITSKRLFIAAPLPAATNKALNYYCKKIEQQHPESKLRLTPIPKRHMTLAFLGDLDHAQISIIRSIVKAFKHPAITLQLISLSRFPDDQSRIITALPAASNELTSLHTQLQQSLESNGFPKLSRPFRPHISLTRIKNLEDNLPIIIQPPIDMPVLEIILYESQLTDTGSHYVPVEKTELLNT